MQSLSLKEWETRFRNYLESAEEFTDGSHDLGHFKRVWRTAATINMNEGGAADDLILLAAAYFHDLVSLPKNDPNRSDSSRQSAEKTVILLKMHFPDFPVEKIEDVYHAIHAHSFSAGIKPQTLEAKVLQDADRMEALGAIGLARVFYTGGKLGQKLFDELDPLAEQREPNDQVYSLDHFKVKLFKLPALMNTRSGREMAEVQADFLKKFLFKIQAEINGDL